MAEHNAGNADIGQSKIKLINSRMVDARIEQMQDEELRQYLEGLGPLERKRYIYLADKNDQLRAELQQVTEATHNFLDEER